MAHTSIHGMMTGDADMSGEARAPVHGWQAPDSTLEKMWLLATEAVARNDTERLRNVAIMALQNPEAVSGKPDGAFSVEVTPVKHGSQVTLNFAFMGVERPGTPKFLTSYSLLDLYLGKKHETLQALYETCKAQEDLAKLNLYLSDMEFKDGVFSIEKRRGFSAPEARVGGSFLMTVQQFKFFI